jgi:hypothetical protein
MLYMFKQIRVTFFSGKDKQIHSAITGNEKKIHFNNIGNII